MTKKCPKCGAELADDAQFCVNCGAKQEAILKCPKCGHINKADSEFCTECGARLKEEAKPADADSTKVVVAEPVRENAQAGNGGRQGGFQNFQMPPMPSDNGKKKKILAIVGVVVVLIGLFFAFSGGSKMTVKSNEVVEDYIRDQSSGEKKYKGKNLQISGKVKWKGQFSNSQDYGITLESRTTGGKTYQVIIAVPAKKADVVNSLKSGDFVNAEGECVGIVKQKSPTVVSVQIQAKKVNDKSVD
jgi:ribosomal protein L40E